MALTTTTRRAVGPFVEFVSNNWRVRTGRTTVNRLRYKLQPTIPRDSSKQSGCVFATGKTDIRISAEAPPSGDVLSPRADNGRVWLCVMTVRYPSQPAVTEYCDGLREMSKSLSARQRPRMVPSTNSTNTDDLVPEGRHEIDLVLDDEKGGATVINSGGRLLTEQRPW